MNQHLVKLAQNAAAAYGSQRGFLECRIESDNPPVLAYEFESAQAAQEFQFELNVKGVQTAISEHHPTTVLQRLAETELPLRLEKTKEQWFESFRLEGLENVQRDFSQDRWKLSHPEVHEYAREWIAQQLRLTPSEPDPKPRWSRGDLLALIGILIAIAAIIASLFVPEVRRFFGY
jgi:hypothetical protein